MQNRNFFDIIRQNRYAKLQQPLGVKDVILLQKELNDNGLCAVPESFLPILHFSNGFSCNSSLIFGVFADNPLMDIASQNIYFGADKNILFLGANEMDLFAYNSKETVYQILDRDDGEILAEYDEKELFSALLKFLKIKDDKHN